VEIFVFNPKYRILLTSKCFPGDTVVCLGTQLISIINALHTFLPKHTWYGTDVDAVGKNAMKLGRNDFRLNLIGSDLNFIEYCLGIDQFIWGDFLCIDSNFSSQNIQSVELETEDEQFRSIACNGILVEIRTFDTSFFEIFLEDKTIMEKASRQFNPIELTCKDEILNVHDPALEV
jgi:hypothetical protein